MKARAFICALLIGMSAASAQSVCSCTVNNEEQKICGELNNAAETKFFLNFPSGVASIDSVSCEVLDGFAPSPYLGGLKILFTFYFIDPQCGTITKKVYLHSSMDGWKKILSSKCNP
jgi:hypothetical protein